MNLSARTAHYYFIVLICIAIIIQLFILNERSLSLQELRYIDTNAIGAWIFSHGVWLFGSNNFGYLAPFVLCFAINTVLFYILAIKTLQNYGAALLATMIFILMPAGILSGSLVNESGVILFFLLALLCTQCFHYEILFYILLFLSLFISPCFIVVYAALLLYGLLSKRLPYILAGVSLAVVRISLGLSVSGVPRGFFLDTLGGLGLLFSPALFVYYVYCLYRILIKEHKNFLFWTSFIGLVWILVISMRQKIVLSSFVPFLIPGIILCVHVFSDGFFVRLRPFRKAYLRWFAIGFAILLCFWFSLIGGKIFYLFLDDAKEHFAYKFQIIKELALELKHAGFKEISAESGLQRRLALYGIAAETTPRCFVGMQARTNARVIEINYLGKVVERFYISC